VANSSAVLPLVHGVAKFFGSDRVFQLRTQLLLGLRQLGDFGVDRLLVIVVVSEGGVDLAE